MQVHWCLVDLIPRYPELATGGPVFRCTREASGHGRYIKSNGSKRLFADVALSVRPHETLALHLHHAWPTHLPISQTEALDEALFEGVMEAVLHPGHHLYGCSIATETVGFEDGATIRLSVKIAAYMAVVDVLKQGGWDGDDPSGPALAQHR